MATTLKLSEHQAETIGRLNDGLTSTWAQGYFDNPDERIGKLTGIAVKEFSQDAAEQARRGQVIRTTQPHTLKALLEYWELNDLAEQIHIDK
ncbi:hypothetical protein [Chromohalobacter moromii]|uniref:Uncharacterized protein n=1 Tax=Chromohalobacter moromii TaxID=2860329 RepID=A0A9X2X404_9GAMM|nr:hypothetical protein [Chromohalobacter moromii]MCT8506183.1 hypothetical protein [Chromohalobacter moromii]